ncbi:helix-turn-helix domain-containing protein [Filimonas effusa]|uniref:XRE family transcriptional regulator n=1 Tax=Filimonas effusa TaxID=2508721 RepID=A0A4Q1D4A1_9BACT|nr:helix-turn-helix transcriptional regulator [Filimonas effusa]RXK81977.1 XRE family transcriptional regulator [Filimonas effusa]
MKILLTLNYLPENLYFLRKQRKLRQDEMLAVLGISGGTWSNYENGKTEPQIQTLIDIAVFFEVNIDDLLRVSLSNHQSIVAQSPGPYQSAAKRQGAGSGDHPAADSILKEMLDEIKGMRTDLRTYLDTKL